MHEELFHSPDRPFRATPDSKFYFPHESVETARQTIVRAVMRAEGPVMVLGGAGLGKSLLGMVVAEDLDSRFDVVKLHAARLCSRRALLQSILFELQLPYRDMTEGDLRLSILDRLEPSSKHAPDGILIIVDEADTLPAKLLDELRLITNFTRGNQPRVRLVLIGNLRLEHTFAEPQMESFNQRLAARCYLQPMNRQQTRDYVRHQLTAAGVEPRQMITDEALATVYAASEGVPRLSNQIMDHALVLAITRGQCPLSSALVEEAWADLQQLPAPWHSGADGLAGSNSSRDDRGASTVEFGTLDDDDDLDEPRSLSVDPTRDRKPTERARQSAAEPAAEEPPVTFQPAADEQELTFAGDSDSELRLADESTDEFIPRLKNSFFAAFSPAEEELVDEVQELSLSEEPYSFDLESSATPQCKATIHNGSDNAVESEGCEELTRPRVVFDMQLARERAHQFEFTEVCDELSFAAEPTVDSFFANRPTDERLLALEAEQHELDSLGVWENDPPLIAVAANTGKSKSSKLPAMQIRSPQDLFGSDFEDEECLTGSSTQKPAGRDRVGSQPLAAADEKTFNEKTLELANEQAPRATQQAAEAADYVARIQQFADAVAVANQQAFGIPVATVDEVLADGPEVSGPLISYESAFDTWSVDVATLDVQDEVAVHDEIEDLVSQLNFAAFSVEPFSIEQIEIAPRDQRPQPAVDAVRNGGQDEVYALHRPQALSEESVFSGWTAASSNSQDDDRDLIVVEEDLPLIAKSTNEAEQPITKIAPYSQLFAKLRK